jgi:hypothetical protein
MTYNVNDIIAESARLKNEKHFVNKLPIRRNIAPGRSASDLKSIERILPSKKEEAKKTNELATMLNTATRAGAGGTRVGLPGIRPHGGKAASAFLENFTGVGRFKPQPAPFTEPLQIKEKRNENARSPAVVLYKLCMDCMQPVSRDDCIPNMTIVPPPEMCAPAVTEKWKSVGLRAHDILCYIFHTSCVQEAQKQSKEPSKQLRVISFGQETTLAALEMKQRGERIADQVYALIKAERNNPDSDIFYGRAKENIC